MRKFLFVGLLGLSAAFWSASCQGPDELYRNGGISLTGAAGNVSQTGGQGGGGSTGSAGSKVTGLGTGGATGRAGTSGSLAGTSGNAGINGGAGTNGRAGTNGAAGTFGAAGTNGAAGTFGAAGTNGRAGTSGGIAGTTGGAAGTTGTTGVAGTNGAGGAAKNCIDAIKLNGYSATGAQPCSMCKNNQTDESSKCEKTIDCEDAAYPCDSNCKLNCQNSQGDDSIVTGCVTSLLAAASCS